MRVTELSLPGLFLVEPRIFKDGRGYFFESYNQERFHREKLDVSFVQDNQSYSAKGVLRGLHYQVQPKAQDKLVRVLSGSLFDVVVDLRKKSSTFGKYFSITLDAESHKALFIPAGFAHGFCALEDHTAVLYKVSSSYAPECERGIIWNDPELGIQWPKLDVAYALSDKDKEYPHFKDAEHF